MSTKKSLVFDAFDHLEKNSLKEHMKHLCLESECQNVLSIFLATDQDILLDNPYCKLTRLFRHSEARYIKLVKNKSKQCLICG